MKGREDFYKSFYADLIETLIKEGKDETEAIQVARSIIKSYANILDGKIVFKDEELEKIKRLILGLTFYAILFAAVGISYLFGIGAYLATFLNLGVDQDFVLNALNTVFTFYFVYILLGYALIEASVLWAKHRFYVLLSLLTPMPTLFISGFIFVFFLSPELAIILSVAASFLCLIGGVVVLVKFAVKEFEF